MATLATGVTPEFRIVSGVRRVTQQQTQPLEELGVKLTAEVIDKIKWEAFWDAPLYIEGSGELPPTHAGVDSADGRHRQPARAAAQARGGHARDGDVTGATSCEVKTNGARLEVTFPGVELGVFAGRLQYNVYKGTNLIRQVGRREDRASASVAYKYNAGLKGLAIQPASRVVWRDLANRWQDNQLRRAEQRRAGHGAASSNRLIVAERAGRIDRRVPAAAQLLLGARGRSRISATTGTARTATPSFSFGIRQAEKEEDPGVPAQLRALQRASRHLAADAGVLLRQRRTPARRRSTGARRSRTAIASSRCPATR